MNPTLVEKPENGYNQRLRKLIVSVRSSDQQHVLEDYIEVHVAHASVQQKNDLHETLIWNTGQG